MTEDQTAAPGAGHNSIGVSEDKYHAFMAAHIDLDEQAAIIAQKRKKLRKSMRAEGIRLTEFDAAMKFAEMSRADVQDHFVHLQQYMRWNRHPVGTQFSLDLGGSASGDFEDEEAIKARASETAIQDGFFAGISNKPMSSNPHDDNTDAGQAWIKAWHDGQERRKAESIDPLDDTDDGEPAAAPAKGGRKRGGLKAVD